MTMHFKKINPSAVKPISRNFRPIFSNYYAPSVFVSSKNKSVQHHNSFTLHLIQNRTIFSIGSKSETKSDSHLHLYMLKEGNKNLESSPVQSITDFDQALQYEETSEAYTKRAFAYFIIKDYKQAERDGKKALKLNPRSIESYCALGSIKIAQEDHQGALDYLSTAYELTSPVDFRRNAIQEVINGIKLALQGVDFLEHRERTKQFENENKPLLNETPKMNTLKNNEELNKKSDNVEVAEIVSNTANSTNTDSNPNLNTNTNPNTNTNLDSNPNPNPNLNTNINTDTNAEEIKRQATKAMESIPFHDSKFYQVQKEITEQMISIGGEEFKSKLLKLNDIPAVKEFNKKYLLGQKPTYNDYMELMKDPKFQKYNSIMGQIAQNPKFSKIIQKFATQDWNGAYNELSKDPEALRLYMKAFDEIK